MPSIYDEFMPGVWIDNLDVNDFVSLNQKPFLGFPNFLKKPTERTNKLFQKTMWKIEEEIEDIKSEYSDVREYRVPKEDPNDLLRGMQSDRLEKKIGFNEKGTARNRKTPFEKIQSVLTQDCKKMEHIHLFIDLPTTYNAHFLQPDCRVPALYGTKKMIEDKKRYFKSLEKNLQTQDWVEKRLDIQEEIESITSFENFCKLHHMISEYPSETAKHVIQMTYLSILYTVIENPSIPFSLPDVCNFFDIFIEREMERGAMTEEEAQELIDQFYIKLITIRFSVSKSFFEQKDKTQPFTFLLESIHTNAVTKTTYRFLRSIRNFYYHTVYFKVYRYKDEDENIISWINQFKQEERFQRIIEASVSVDKRKKVGEYANFHSGVCDLEKAFYLSLNGGKDIRTNTNLKPITQPFRKDKIHYQEVLNKLEYFLIYVINTYVEAMNVIAYINENNQYSSFKSAQMFNFKLYEFEFSFSKLVKVALILTAIKNENFRVLKNSDGWISKVEIDQEEELKKHTDFYLIINKMYDFIKSEIGKNLIYKNGSFQTKIIVTKEEWFQTEEVLFDFSLV